jgi:hypothetical protein
MWQSLLIVLGLLVTTCLAVWSIVSSFSHWFSSLGQNTQTALIGATALLTVPLVTYFTAKSIERRRSVEQALRLKKVEVYRKFIEFFMTLFLNGTKPKPSQNDMLDFFCDITPEIITYASNDVIKQWGKYRVNLDNLIKSNDPLKTVSPLESLLKAMRKDLGHSSFGLNEGDISRLFINDIDDYLGPNKTKD